MDVILNWVCDLFTFNLLGFSQILIYFLGLWLIAGVMFQDITTMLLDPQAFKDTIDLFVERYKGKDISVVAGINIFHFNYC